MRKKLFLHKKANAGVKGGFKIEIQTTSDGQSFTLPLVDPSTIRGTEGGVAADYGYDFIVDWGDGNTSTVQAYNDANRVHSYETAGTYNIEIKGQCDGWSFNNAGSKLLITKIKSWGGEDFDGFCYLGYGFRGCTNLASLPEKQAIKRRINVKNLEYLFYYNPIAEIPSDLFKYCVDVKNFRFCFNGCTRLTELPADLFKYNTLVTNFEYCFWGCSNIATIPSGLFDNNTLVTNFELCFCDCTRLTEIPSDLFKYCVDVKNFRFCFNGCTRLTELPADLFKYNTLVTNFERCFNGCSQLTSIPSGLFDNNTLVTNFEYCFWGCSQLTSIPSGLFDNNTLVTNFRYCFCDCSKLQLRTDIFDFANFLNKNMKFGNCFYRSSFTGVQGTAPALWEADYGTGTPTTTGCFGGGGNSATSLTNYADIPAEWK